MHIPKIEQSHSRCESASRQRWCQVQERLLTAKAQINQSIREYPLPITACDDQFNYLLEKRSAITLEIGRFNRLQEEAGAGQREQEALDEFVISSQFVNS